MHTTDRIDDADWHTQAQAGRAWGHTAAVFPIRARFLIIIIVCVCRGVGEEEGFAIGARNVMISWGKGHGGVRANLCAHQGAGI